MPVDIDSDVWADAEDGTSIHAELLEFLRANEEWAFHAREMADEILETSWGMAHRREREIQELGEEEFYRRLEAGEYEGEFDVGSGGEAIADSIKTQTIIAILHSFANEGTVEVRRISIDETDIPYRDWDEVEHFTYAGD